MKGIFNSRNKRGACLLPDGQNGDQMNLLVLTQFESPLAAIGKLQSCLSGFFSSSERRPLSVSSVCHKVQMAERRCDARLSGGLAGHHSGSQPEWPAGSCSLLLSRWLSSTRISAPRGVLVLPNLEDRRSDSTRVLVLPKLCPTMTKLWTPKPKVCAWWS